MIGEVASKNRSAIGRGILNSWIAEGVIEYLGTVEDVRPAIEAATCIVLPSYREGVPRALIEAAAMARPVITTDVPGCRAVVDHDISGFLCEVRNSESLTAAIERFSGTVAGGKTGYGSGWPCQDGARIQSQYRCGRLSRGNHGPCKGQAKSVTMDTVFSYRLETNQRTPAAGHLGHQRKMNAARRIEVVELLIANNSVT